MFKRLKKNKEMPKTYTYETDVHKRIEALENTVKDLKAENEKLHRIMKYSSSIEDMFTHHLEALQNDIWSYSYGYHICRETHYNLYVYFNKEEHCIPLPELNNEIARSNTGILNTYKIMGDDYVSFKVESALSGCNKIIRKHQFIINYKTGQYIHTVEEDLMGVFVDDCMSSGDSDKKEESYGI